MARTTKLTPELQSHLCEALSAGNTRKTACASVGITHATLLNWLHEGERSNHGQFFELFEAVKRAEAEAVKGFMSVIKKAALKGNWTAAAWWLERNYPDDYGRKDKLETKSQITTQPLPLSESETAIRITELLKVAEARKDDNEQRHQSTLP